MYYILILSSCILIFLFFRFRKFIISTLKENSFLKNIIINLFNLFITIYTVLQIWYNNFYDNYLKELMKKNKIYNYYIINQDDILIKSFSSDNYDYEVINKNELIIKEIIDNERTYLYANLFEKKTHIKSNILGGSFIFSLNKEYIEYDITNFLQSFVSIKDTKIQLLKNFYELKYPNKLDKYKEYSLEKIKIINDDCDEIDYNTIISINSYS